MRRRNRSNDMDKTIRRMMQQDDAAGMFRELKGREPDPHVMVPAFICDLVPVDAMPWDWKLDPPSHLLLIVSSDFNDPHEAAVAKAMTDSLHRAQEHQAECLKCTNKTWVAHRMSECDYLWLLDHYPDWAQMKWAEARFAESIGAVPTILFA